MASAVVEDSLQIETLQMRTTNAMNVGGLPALGTSLENLTAQCFGSDPANRELLGGASESSGEKSKYPWIFDAMDVVNRAEDVQVFESAAAMRFGPRYYTDEQFDRIRRATAERVTPVASPIPLDD